MWLARRVLLANAVDRDTKRDVDLRNFINTITRNRAHPGEIAKPSLLPPRDRSTIRRTKNRARRTPSTYSTQKVERGRGRERSIEPRECRSLPLHAETDDNWSCWIHPSRWYRFVDVQRATRGFHRVVALLRHAVANERGFFPRRIRSDTPDPPGPYRKSRYRIRGTTYDINVVDLTYLYKR